MFSLILKDTPKKAAIQTCSFATLRQLCKSPHPIGLACYASDATSKKELARAADDALYVSKRQGRNRATSAPTLNGFCCLRRIFRRVDFIMPG